MDEEMLKAADKMRCLCSRREYCSSDIRKKLETALGGNRERIEKVLEVLKEERYVDDLRYAEAYAGDKSALAGWGPVKIRYMLSAKGIPEDIMASALEKIDPDKADARMVKVLAEKMRSLKGDKDSRVKLIRFGLGRGYGYQDICRFIDEKCSADN